MNYLITVSYDGSKYYGFQRLNDLPTVQKELEDALSIINKDIVLIKGSGRTDRGVHAFGQTCSFKLNQNISCNRLINAINSLVSKYIRVTHCINVDDNFHARFSVVKKVYFYKINIGNYDPLKEDYYYNYCNKLNISKMKKASNYLLGAHNFKNFVSGYRNNYDSIIYNISFIKKRDTIIIKYIGKSFYRYMVRNLTGALILVGSGKITLEEFKNILDNLDREYSNLTVPANGLYLERVDYK